MIVILGGAFFALGNINPPAEANIQHPLNLLINLLSMKECRFHVLWVFPLSMQMYSHKEAADVWFHVWS